MPPVYPSILKPGDTIALLAPASPLPDPAKLPAVIAAAESFGFNVVPFPTLQHRDDYTAGTGKQRAADLQKAFTSPKIKGVFCLRGGYGTAHVLPFLDMKELAASKKIFAGYSDLTMLLNPIAFQGGTITLHAPTMNFFTEDTAPTQASRKALEHFLFVGMRGISYRDLCGADFKPEVVRKGTVKGRIVGGNVSVFATLIGTPLEPKGKDLILFLEDVHEKPYKMDRYITHMLQTGFFKKVGGVVLGQFTDCNPTGSDSQDALTVLKRLLTPLKIPIIAGMPIGHDRPSYPLPIGAMAELDASKGDLVIV